MKKRKKIQLSLIVPILFANSLYANKNANLDTVTVTANKVEQTMLEIPQSVTIIDDIEIELKGIKSVKDLIREIPNLSSIFQNSEKVNFRGINNSQFTNTNPIVLYINGIPQSNVYGFDVSISNIKRVEVLRGPQGTVYGKDSIGGVINIITKEPTNQLEGALGLEYGTDNFRETSFYLNTPIIENTLFFGIDGILTKSDGYYTNNYPQKKKDANEQDKHLVNLKLNYKPTDELSVKFSASKDKNHKYGWDGSVVSSSANINDFKREDFKNQSYDQDMFTKTKSNAQALRVDYSFNNLSFTSLTTHKTIDANINIEFDFSDDPLYNGLSIFNQNKNQNISQEFRVASQAKDIKWVGGLYYERDKVNFDKNGAQMPGFFFGEPFGSGVNVQTNAITQIKANSYSIFGQAIIPFSNKLELTLGGRYQKIKKELDSSFYMFPINSFDPSIPSFSLDTEHDWNIFLPKLALSYKIKDNINTYLNIAKGYLPGGYNFYTASGDDELNRFDAQKSINYELGIKGSLFDNKLNFSTNIFYMDITDIHVYSFDTKTTQSVVSNAAKAHSQGWELELDYKINDSWTIDGSVGIIKAKYDEYENYENNKIENTPAHSFNLGLSYVNENGYYARADLRNQGDKYFNKENTQKENSFTTVDLKVGYVKENWDFYLYGKNLTDKSYLTSTYNQLTGTVLAFGEGRFIGAGVKYSF